MRKNKGFTLIELMIVIAIIAIIAAIAIPGLLQSQRAANERNASTSLKTLTSAEADFRANDRDGNQVNDFWTFNVAGLYCATSVVAVGSAIGNPADPPVKLIELGVAAADGVGGVNSGAEEQPVSAFTVRGPKSSYWYQSLLSDMSAVGPDQVYRIDTDGAGVYGTVHNTSKYGFSAYPDSLSGGKFAYMVNENNQIYRRPLTATVRPGTATPPGTTAILAEMDRWPTDVSIKAFWGKMD